jgi:hypothetical protein
VDDLVGLIGVLDGAAVLDRRCEQALLLHELDAAAAHPTLGDARPLAAQKDHRRVLHQCALDRAGDVGHAGTQCADAQTGPAGHPRNGLGHEAGAQLVVRRHDRPTAGVGFGEHVHEVGIGDTEQRVDALGFEQVEDAFVNGNTHGGTPLSVARSYVFAVGRR